MFEAGAAECKHLWSVPNVHSHPEHFVVMVAVLKALTRTYVGSYNLEAVGVTTY